MSYFREHYISSDKEQHEIIKSVAKREIKRMSGLEFDKIKVGGEEDLVGAHIVAECVEDFCVIAIGPPTRTDKDRDEEFWENPDCFRKVPLSVIKEKTAKTIADIKEGRAKDITMDQRLYITIVGEVWIHPIVGSDLGEFTMRQFIEDRGVYVQGSDSSDYGYIDITMNDDGSIVEKIGNEEVENDTYYESFAKWLKENQLNLLEE